MLYYQRRIPLQGYYLISAWQDVPKSGIVGMLDTIRTRILNMALEIKSEVGKTDEALEQITPQEKEKVDQTIINNILGGNVYLSAGNSTMTATTIQQQQQNIAAGDWQHLETVLKSAGIAETELKELSRSYASRRRQETTGQRLRNEVDQGESPKGSCKWYQDGRGCWQIVVD